MSNLEEDLLAALEDARLNLAALLARPDVPDFGPATRNNNPADVEQLEQAYNTIHSAIVNARV